jgi:hypothetical protein
MPALEIPYLRSGLKHETLLKIMISKGWFIFQHTLKSRDDLQGWDETPTAPKNRFL